MPNRAFVLLTLLSLTPACGSDRGMGEPGDDDDGGDAGGGGDGGGGAWTSPDFMVDGKQAIFTEITAGEGSLTIDVAGQTAQATSRLDIIVHQEGGGYPLFDLVPADATTVSVDGGAPVALLTVDSPDGLATMRMVDAELAPGEHTLEVAYDLARGTDPLTGTALEGISFGNGGGFAFQTDHDDLQPRHFTERYWAAGFERDRYPFTLAVQIDGAGAGQLPDVMTNADKTVVTEGERYELRFRDIDGTSCWFVHVIDRNQYAIATGTFTSSDGRVIDLTAYAIDADEADLALADTSVLLAELEADYGPYPHESFLVAINTTQNDPMEYVAAAQSDLDASEATPDDRGALGHELVHMWFGRSARPYAGRDGWVDEGIADWRDSGYPRAASIELDGDYAVLAMASPYETQTPDESYEQGSEIIADLDLLLADQGGMKPVLAAFAAEYKDRLFTTEDFLDFIRARAPELVAEMDPIFAAKVYAGAAPP